MDLMHAGHVTMLQQARNQCDHLIVALHVDPSKERKAKNKPVQTVFERYVQLQACAYVSRIIPYETEDDLYNILTILEPDVRFLGEDWEGKPYTGFDLDIEVVFLSRKHNYSSSELRERCKK